MPTYKPSTDEQPASTGARKKSRSRRPGKGGGGDPDAAWQQSGAKLRAAWEALEADAAGEPRLQTLRGRNLQERITAMLYVMDASGAGPASVAHYLPPAPAVPGAESGVSLRQVEAEESPAARSAGNRNAESIELPLWGAGATAAYTAAQAAGGPGLTERLAEAGRRMAAQGSTMMQTTSVLMAAAAAQVNPRAVSQTLGATALLGGLAYAWYSMFGRQEDESTAAYEQLAEMTGLLTEDERAVLDTLFHSIPPSTSEPVNSLPEEILQPYSKAEMDELIALVAELEADDTADSPTEMATIPVTGEPHGVRVKRSQPTVPSATVDTTATMIAANSTATQSASRQAYWAKRYEEAKEDNSEKTLFALLKAGPQPSGKYSLAAPRESFPLRDAWYTRMDQLNIDSFEDVYREKLLQISVETANDMGNIPPYDLPTTHWLHVGYYYKRFYRSVLREWAEALVRHDMPVARQLKDAATRIQALTEALKKDWGEKMILESVLDKLNSKMRRLEGIHTLHDETNVSKSNVITRRLKAPAWKYKVEIPAGDNFWEKYSLSYLQHIDLSRFTSDFTDTLKQFVKSSADYQETTDNKIDLVKLYTGMSILAVKRLLEAVEVDDVKKAYNYAVLDEELRGIIDENISRLWGGTQPTTYITEHDKGIAEVLQQLPRMRERLKQKETQEVQTTTEGAVTEENNKETSTMPTQKMFVDVDWNKLHRDIEQAELLPEERFSARQYILDKMQEKIEQTFTDLTGFLNEKIISPGDYIDFFINESLRKFGLDKTWSPDSVAYVEPYRRPFSEEKPSTYPLPKTYTLRELVIGKLRKDTLDMHQEYEVQWPRSFPEELQRHFDHGLEKSIKTKLEEVFVSDSPAGRPRVERVYQTMIRQAALNYIERKKAEPTLLGAYRVYVEAVESFLEGKTEAEIVQWHGSDLSGMFFIPLSTDVVGENKMGVLLSLWGNDYYEVPWPGFSVQQREKYPKDRTSIPPAFPETNPRLRKFIEKHRTIRTGNALAKIEHPFEYRRVDVDTTNELAPGSGEIYTLYHPPFTTYNPGDIEDLVSYLVSMQHMDMVKLYDELIVSSGEFQRAKIYELVNTLSIMVGITMIFGGIVIGGPAWAWLLASLTATLLVDVVPNAVLYSQADDEEERARYLYSIIMAVAFELGGNAVSAAAGPLLKAAANRAARLGTTAIRTTLPKMYRHIIDKLKLTGNPLKVELLRKVGKKNNFVNKQTDDDLRRILTKPDVQDDEVDAVGALDIVQSRPRVEKWNKELVETANELRQHGFDTWFRVISRWKKVAENKVENTYVIVAKRGEDTAIVSLMREKGKSAFLYSTEDQWLRQLSDSAIAESEVVKYLDYTDFNILKHEHIALADYSGELPAHSYIDDALIVSPPQEYKNIIKSQTGISYDVIQDTYWKLKVKGTERPKKTSASTAEHAKPPSDNATGNGGGKLPPVTQTETIRNIKPSAEIASDMTVDFNAEELLGKLKNNRDIENAINSPGGKCDTILYPIANIIKAEGFSNIRYRGMYMWINAMSMPSNHFVVIAEKNGIDYAIDLTARQFGESMNGFSGPIISREADWAVKYNIGSERRLIKYKDFDQPGSAINNFQSLPVPPDSFIENGVILKMPRWYITLKDARVEEIRKTYRMQEPLSDRILSEADLSAGSSTWKNFDLLPSPQIVRGEGGGKAFRIASQAAELKALGPDITEFYPISKNLGMKNLDEATRTKLIERFKQLPGKNSVYEQAGEDMWQMAFRAKIPAEKAAAANVKESFARAYHATEKVLAIVNEAKKNPEVRQHYISIMARFLNEKDPRILTEAYNRFAVIAEETFEAARFHVHEQLFARVIPLRIKEGKKAAALDQAFVYPYDPAGRIFVVLENYSKSYGGQTALHELTHLSVGSLDFQYMGSGEGLGRLADMKQAHSMFGSGLYSEEGLQFGIGKLQFAASEIQATKMRALTDQERILAQARLTRHRMLSANAKLNNADHIVIFYNALLNAFTITPIPPTGKEVGAFKVKVKPHVMKRSVPVEDENTAAASDIDRAIKREREESALSAFILQGGMLAKEDRLTDLELDEYDIDWDMP
ncbi:Dermonecrotoxin of the Papain-like fold [Kosakonia oryzendophytica]|uniref:Dermonecrotoxin of the Papain-like fold n=1 Tax=Kosakonia oryzendophytica TaxID=1005665 RepID=A0A1C3YQ57_9ENTR|nr:hypothetical protein [Kosakonia oryzendophytica]SCB72226.1 Dermonecrotoxin of the Papain-like fold [Kosakonia oryzendophytica]